MFVQKHTATTIVQLSKIIWLPFCPFIHLFIHPSTVREPWNAWRKTPCRCMKARIELQTFAGLIGLHSIRCKRRTEPSGVWNNFTICFSHSFIFGRNLCGTYWQLSLMKCLCVCLCACACVSVSVCGCVWCLKSSLRGGAWRFIPDSCTVDSPSLAEQFLRLFHSLVAETNCTRS